MSFAAHYDPEALVPCPFDPIHLVSYRRLQYHVNDCQKNHPNSKLIPCPHNARHYLQPEEFQHHLANCKDSSVVERIMNHDMNREVELGGYIGMPTYDEPQHYDGSSDDWDTDGREPELPTMTSSAHSINNNDGATSLSTSTTTSSHHNNHTKVTFKRARPNGRHLHTNATAAAATRVPRAPRDTPEVLKANPFTSSGIGRGYSALAAEPPLWTPAGRGRASIIRATAMADCIPGSRATGNPIRSTGSPAHLTGSQLVSHVRDRSPPISVDTNSDSSSSPSLPRHSYAATMNGLHSESRPITARFSLVGGGRGRGFNSSNMANAS